MEQNLLLRLKPTENNNGIHGLIMNKKGLICHTLELQWKNNKYNDSCIPPGSYVCIKTKSKRLGDCITLLDVENRTNILIHIGNNLEETTGCILAGTYAKPNSITYSKIAMKKLLDNSPHKFILTIIDFIN